MCQVLCSYLRYSVLHAANNCILNYQNNEFNSHYFLHMHVTFRCSVIIYTRKHVEFLQILWSPLNFKYRRNIIGYNLLFESNQMSVIILTFTHNAYKPQIQSHKTITNSIKEMMIVVVELLVLLIL